MTADAVPDPMALLNELESAYAQFDDGRIRLHAACSAVAKDLAACNERLARVESDLETAKNHLRQTKDETIAERDEALARVRTLEGELAVLRGATPPLAEGPSSQKIAELEGSIAVLTEHVTKLALERDAEKQHATAMEAELALARDALSQRPGMEYLVVVEKERNRLHEDLGLMRVQMEQLKAELAQVRAKAELAERVAQERARKVTTSSARVPAAAPPPVPEARGFGTTGSGPRDKPPGSLNVDELLSRAKAVKGPAPRDQPARSAS